MTIGLNLIEPLIPVKFRQSEEAKQALTETGEARLIQGTGKRESSNASPPAKRFCPFRKKSVKS